MDTTAQLQPEIQEASLSPTRVAASPWVGLLAITVLAAGLRAVALGHLSFREDEGFSLIYARQSWPSVLGFHGFYDFHPPLDFSLAKLADLFVPELLASRLVSVVAGIATIPVFFALVTRLLDQRAALGSSLVLALAPGAIEFSRIGRMYAPVSFAIACSYLAIVGCASDGRRRWAALYGFSVALSLYLDYSTLNALLPQTVVLAYVIAQRRRAAAWLIAGGFGGVLLYAPWLTQIPKTVDLANAYTRRATYLNASASHIGTAVLNLTGLTGGGAGARAPWPNLWYRWTELRPLLVLAIVPAAAVGVLVLQRHRFALVVALSLGIGTPLTAIGISQISAGFAMRTVLPATMGWAIVVGAVATRVSLAQWQRAAGLAGAGFVLLASIAALPATYSNAGRALRYDLAANALVDVEPLHWPVLIYSTGGMDTDVIQAFGGRMLHRDKIITFLDGTEEPASAMSRWLGRGPTRLDVEAGQFPQILNRRAPNTTAFWFLTHRGPGAFHTAFAKSGFVEVLNLDFKHLSLELWTKPDAPLGAPIDVNGSFAGDGSNATGWHLPKGATFRADPSGARVLTLPAGRRGRVTRSVEASGAGIYVAGVEQNGQGRVALSLTCLGAGGAALPTTGTPQPVPPSTANAQRLYGGTICPTGTKAIGISIVTDGLAAVTLKRVTLAGTSLG